MIPKERYQKERHDLPSAEARIGGVLRGGVIIENHFCTMNGLHYVSVPVEMVKELKIEKDGIFVLYKEEV